MMAFDTPKPAVCACCCDDTLTTGDMSTSALADKWVRQNFPGNHLSHETPRVCHGCADDMTRCTGCETVMRAEDFPHTITGESFCEVCGTREKRLAKVDQQILASLTPAHPKARAMFDLLDDPSPYVRSKKALAMFAGPNPMQHHAKNEQDGGMMGGMQMFVRLWSAEDAKFQAGEWLVDARECRGRGDAQGHRKCLAKAARWRREAQRRATPKMMAAE